jgi:SAM-dependent methyltransferase
VDRNPDRYDHIGQSYSRTRREDPRLATRIRAALGDATTVINVGAGAGSYEPLELAVVAVEPSAIMIARRRRGAAPVVRAVAESLPFEDDSFDAAMAVLTVHHWSDPKQGLLELRRVARRVVIVSASTLPNNLWMTRDYFPATARLRRPEIHPGVIAAVLGGTTRVEPLPLPHDCADGFYETFWGRPEAYLDPQVRSGMSAFMLLDPSELDSGLSRLAADLSSGAWDTRYRDLGHLPELDCGHRLIVADWPDPVTGGARSTL